MPTDALSFRCKHRHTAESHPYCYERYLKGEKEVRFQGLQVEKAPVSILSVDVETLPIVAYTWGPYDQDINPIQLIKDWCLLSYSAKWLDSPFIMSGVLSPKNAKQRNDEKISRELWYLLDRADIVIGHNSKRFDVKKINTRFWKHGLHKPRSYRHIDTLTSARQIFGLTYNKLDFIAEFIGIQRKLETGFSLWKQCDNGDPEALQKMKEYNERDVELQENIYLSMREWIPNHPNLSVYSGMKDICPICLGTSYKEVGLYTSNQRRYREYRCSCGAVWHNTKPIRE